MCLNLEETIALSFLPPRQFYCHLFWFVCLPGFELRIEIIPNTRKNAATFKKKRYKFDGD